MAIILEKQFHKLKNIIMNVNKYYWSGSDNLEYTGPINPTGIVNLDIPKVNKSVNFLILAEGVPIKFFPHKEGYPGMTLGIVLVSLDDKFEIKDAATPIKEIRVLGMGCKDGSANGLTGENSSSGSTYSVLYHA